MTSCLYLKTIFIESSSMQYYKSKDTTPQCSVTQHNTAWRKLSHSYKKDKTSKCMQWPFLKVTYFNNNKKAQIFEQWNMKFTRLVNMLLKVKQGNCLKRSFINAKDSFSHLFRIEEAFLQKVTHEGVCMMIGLSTERVILVSIPLKLKQKQKITPKITKLTIWSKLSYILWNN